jgi:ABC-type nitrate/sulfonate/bicarbonate transport system permease component
MDVERSLGRLESSVAELERSTAQHAKDLNGLGKVAHTASMFGKVALGLATPVAAAIIIAVLVYIYRIVERLLLLPVLIK